MVVVNLTANVTTSYTETYDTNVIAAWACVGSTWLSVNVNCTFNGKNVTLYCVKPSGDFYGGVHLFALRQSS